MFKWIREWREHKRNIKEGERIRNSCEGCIYLYFNSGGGVECEKETERKCSPYTRVLKTYQI